MRPLLLVLAFLPLVRFTWAQVLDFQWPRCGNRPSFQEAFSRATLVLAGRVLQSEPYQQSLVTGTSRSTWRMHRVIIEVSRGWKGQPRDTITIDTPPPDEDSSTIHFQVNEQYLLYLSSSSDEATQRGKDTIAHVADLLWDHPEYLRCSRTAKLTVSSDDLRLLGPPTWTRH